MSTHDIDEARQRRELAYADPNPIVGEAERKAITNFCRQHWHRLERAGQVPRRVKLGSRKIGWYLRELLEWRDGRAALRDAGGTDADQAA